MRVDERAWGVGKWPGAASGLMLAGLLVGLMSGCGRSEKPPVVSVYEVKGRVLLADKTPLTRGKVLFVPTTQEPLLLASSEIAPDGSFALTTGESGTGAPAGDYRVRIEPEGPPPVVGAARPRRGAKNGLPFAPRYLDEDSSGLTATVRAEANTLAPFVLK